MNSLFLAYQELFSWESMQNLCRLIIDCVAKFHVNQNISINLNIQNLMNKAYVVALRPAGLKDLAYQELFSWESMQTCNYYTNNISYYQLEMRILTP